MSQLLTISQITQEALPVLQNKLIFSRAVNKEYSDEFARTGAKIGNTVNVRRPPRYTVSSGPALDLQDSIETYVPVTLTDQSHIDLGFTSADFTLSVDDFRARFLEPAMTQLANYIDFTAAQRVYQQVANHIGTPGNLASMSTAQQAATYILQAKQRLIEAGAPDDEQLAFLVNPSTQTYLVSLFTNLFNPAGTISKQFTRGAMGDGVLGFNFAASANIPSHTYGSYVQGTSPAITASAAFAGNTGPGSDITASYAVTIVLAAAGTQTLTAGTVITFANVYDVNPQTRQSTGSLKQFVLTAPVTFNGTTAVSASIWPAPVFSGQFQNCTSSTNTIASGAAVTVPTVTASASYAQNLAFHPTAFTLATADLELVNDGATSARAAWKGVSLRILRSYLPNSDQPFWRADVLWGIKAVYPEIAVRCTG